MKRYLPKYHREAWVRYEFASDFLSKIQEFNRWRHPVYQENRRIKDIGGVLFKFVATDEEYYKLVDEFEDLQGPRQFTFMVVPGMWADFRRRLVSDLGADGFTTEMVGRSNNRSVTLTCHPRLARQYREVYCY